MGRAVLKKLELSSAIDDPGRPAALLLRVRPAGATCARRNGACEWRRALNCCSTIDDHDRLAACRTIAPAYDGLPACRGSTFYASETIRGLQGNVRGYCEVV